jgi:methylamine dehydrogenase accessory protein MauD
VLPLLELLVAAALVITPTARVGAVGAVVLLGAFLGAIGRAMARGEAPDCHCFGQIHSEPAGRSTLARNAALAAAAVVALVLAPGRSLAHVGGEEAALLGTSLATLALGAVSLTLWRDNRELKKRPAPRRRPMVEGLPNGSFAPDLPLSTLAGEKLTLHELISSGRPTALVQISPKCGPCRTLVPELIRWQRALAHELNVVAISSGSPEANQAFSEEHGLTGLYLENGQSLGDVYRVKPTPSAVLVDEQGRIAAAPATGAVAIEALIRLGLDTLKAPA